MYICVTHFYDLSALVCCWSSVSRSIRRIIYKFLNVCPFDYTAVSGKVVRTLTGLTTPVGLTAVTPTGLPKSVHNRCVIEIFLWLFYVVTMLFGFFCGCRAFVIGLSQISFSFFHLLTDQIVDKKVMRGCTGFNFF